MIGPNPIASPSRLWRDLDETSIVGKLDIEIPIQASSFSGKISLGASKISKELGWKPSLQFEEGLEKTVDWYLSNSEWLDKITSGDYQKYYAQYYA